ncbi:hypothetical protein DFH06DRAFT_1139504 [Mycena polygramma]|nr:hypothetical protein DFH06DRAFT_1139504 [Mycena polygramma]
MATITRKMRTQQRRMPVVPDQPSETEANELRRAELKMSHRHGQKYMHRNSQMAVLRGGGYAGQDQAVQIPITILIFEQSSAQLGKVGKTRKAPPRFLPTIVPALATAQQCQYGGDSPESWGGEHRCGGGEVAVKPGKAKAIAAAAVTDKLRGKGTIEECMGAGVLGPVWTLTFLASRSSRNAVKGEKLKLGNMYMFFELVRSKR